MGNRWKDGELAGVIKHAVKHTLIQFYKNMRQWVEQKVRQIKRWLNRCEWLIHLLNLPTYHHTDTGQGVVLIQIDGLSRTQFERALQKGHTPFLGTLCRKKHYQLYSFYSGIPSSTPAVQGELFFGVTHAVPSFSFYDRQSDRVQVMYEAADAREVELRLKSKGTRLLSGGSAYADIFSGGAEETHFCISDLGLQSILHSRYPPTLLILLLHFYSLIRTSVLVLVELVLAISDCVRGIIDGRDLWEELKLVPSRVGISILLRELVTIGAKIDVARGLPIIHVTMLGYDEQAHRRGPSSLFAHWTLRGIDDAVKRIWRAAQHSPARNYTVLIYSDHGQEKTVPYEREHHVTVQQAIKKVVREDSTSNSTAGSRQRGIQSQRIRMLGSHLLQKILPPTMYHTFTEDSETPVITDMGPVAHIYFQKNGTGEDRHRIAQKLVESASVPMVLTADHPHCARVWTEKGEFVLPSQAVQVFGASHPFLEEVARDMVTLCEQRNAGDLIICGWRESGTSNSFQMENGAHGGPGSEETRGFALVPGGVSLPKIEKQYLRPLDLRKSVQYLMREHT